MYNWHILLNILRKAEYSAASALSIIEPPMGEEMAQYTITLLHILRAIRDVGDYDNCDNLSDRTDYIEKK